MSNDKQAPPHDFYKQASEVLGEDFWQEMSGLIPNPGPRIDMYYTSNHIVVLAEIPGLQSPDQIGIMLEGQTLILEGEIPCAYPVTDNRIIQKERFFGKFRRTLQLPKPVILNQANAKYARGLLTIEMEIELTVPQSNITLEFS